MSGSSIGRLIVLTGILLFGLPAVVLGNQAETNQSFIRNDHAPAFGQLKGPYLGQEPPGMERELFAPGILSDGLFNGLVFFTAGGTEVYFSSGFEKPFYISIFFHSYLQEGCWTEPMEFPLARSVFHRPVLNPDGTRVFFISSQLEDRPEGEDGLIRIYYLEKKNQGWSDPQMIDFGEAFPYSCSQTSVAASGNLNFQAGYHIDGDEDIYFSRYAEGNYLPPVRLPDLVNGPEHDVHPCIAPDESYLIFDSARPGGCGNNDLYISFRGSDGQWTQAQNMGPKVNADSDERRASVSFDGKYLFFESKVTDAMSRLPEPPLSLHEFRNYLGSAENGGGDIYWIDAMVIEELRQ